MKRYTKMRPSGVAWLGDIPDGWIVNRLKFSATINNEKLPDNTPPDFEMEYVDIGSVDSIAGIVETEVVLFENAPSRARRIVRDGDTIISTVRTYLRAIAPIKTPPNNLIVSTGFAVLRPRSVDADYLGYAVREKSFVDTIVSVSTGVSYPAINAPDIGGIAIPVPPLHDQKAIAAYLDRETRRIDELITKKRTLIERLKEKRTALISRTVTRGLPADLPQDTIAKLEEVAGEKLKFNPKLKPSGVEWLGEVPEHWEVSTVRRFAERIQTGSTPATSEEQYYQDGVIPWYGPGSFDYRIVLSQPVKLLNPATVTEGAARLFRPGTMMIVAIGATLGKVSSLESVASCNQQITGVQFDTNSVFPRFATYQMKRLELALRAIAPSSTLPILDQRAIGSLPLCLPKLHEQRAIASYLDVETSRIDSLVSRVESAIERLKEFRSALITAAVTGKIDVRAEVNSGPSTPQASTN